MGEKCWIFDDESMSMDDKNKFFVLKITLSRTFYDEGGGDGGEMGENWGKNNIFWKINKIWWILNYSDVFIDEIN